MSFLSQYYVFVAIGGLIFGVVLFLNVMKAYKFNYRVNQFFNASQYPSSERRKMKRLYKQALREFDSHYIKFKDYIRFTPKQIMTCDYLTKKSIDSSFYSSYQIDCNRYNNTNIRDEAVERIKKCLHGIYVIKSGISYYENQIALAEKTIQLLHREGDKCRYKRFYYPLFRKRTTYLQKIITQCAQVKNNLEQQLPQYQDAIRKLEQMKKPTVFDMVFNVLTAPIRNTFNLVDSLISGNEGRAIKSGTKLALGIFGVGLIGDAIDALDAFDALDLSSFNTGDLEFVAPHEVDGYLRADGTYVESYWRDGDGNPFTALTGEDGGGYFRRG